MNFVQPGLWRLSLVIWFAVAFGLAAGVWLDRTRRKPILVASQAVSAAALATIPAAALLHHLTIGQLYVVAFAAGAAATVQGIAAPAIVPALAGRDRLVQANTRIQSSFTVSNLVGPGLAGAAVQAFTAPLAIAADAVSFVVGAIMTAWNYRDEILAKHKDWRAKGGKWIIPANDIEVV